MLLYKCYKEPDLSFSPSSSRSLDSSFGSNLGSIRDEDVKGNSLVDWYSADPGSNPAVPEFVDPIKT